MFEQMIREKLAAQTALVNKAVAEKRAMSADEQTQYDALESDIVNLEKSLDAQKKAEARAAAEKAPVNTPITTNPRDEGKLFKNLGDQLFAVKKAATTGERDPRLDQLNKRNAATGMNEGLGADGGFVVQTDFAGSMMESAAKAGQILPLVDQYEVTGPANGVKWNDIDESSVATTVFGGVQVYWAGEAVAVTASKPKLTEKKLELEKLMGMAYATYELEQDSGGFVSQLYSRAFELGIQRKLEEAIINGTGAGQPLGILKTAALVSIAKEVNQPADTIVWENLSKMYNRALSKDQIQNYAWICHPDCAEQFDFLNFPVGVGGVPVYLSASSVGSVSTLKGRPIIETDQCSALGDKGDILFVNLKEYILIRKGGVQMDTSMHVQFLAAENAFRFIFRANGMPKRTSALTIKNSSNQRSPYVTLNERA